MVKGAGVMGWRLLVGIGLGAWMSMALAAESSSKAELYGQWRLVGGSVEIPVNCRRAELDISPSGVVSERTYSQLGELFALQAQASIAQQGSLYTLALRQIKHNGQPDCLGQEAEFVVRHLPATLQLEVNGDRLFHYLNGNRQGAYLRYERMGLEPQLASNRLW